MIFEGLAKRILKTLHPTLSARDRDDNDITATDLAANHQRYGDILDKNYTDQQILDKKLGSNPPKPVKPRQIQSFKTFTLKKKS